MGKVTFLALGSSQWGTPLGTPHCSCHLCSADPILGILNDVLRRSKNLQVFHGTRGLKPSKLLLFFGLWKKSICTGTKSFLSPETWNSLKFYFSPPHWLKSSIFQSFMHQIPPLRRSKGSFITALARGVVAAQAARSAWPSPRWWSWWATWVNEAIIDGIPYHYLW